MNKINKYVLIMVILINVAIFGGLALFITGGVLGIKWLTYFAFGFVGVVGILCPIISLIIKIMLATKNQKEIVKKQLNYAKQTIKQMNKKDRRNFILLTTLIVTVFLSIIVLSFLRLYVFMFAFVGIFIGIGVVGAIISTINHNNYRKKILTSPDAKEYTVKILGKEEHGYKMRYNFIIEQHSVYDVVKADFNVGDTVTVLYLKTIPNHCAILHS